MGVLLLGRSIAYEGLVASRARMLGSFSNVLNQCMSRTAHIASENLTSIRVCFQNFYNCTNQGGGPIADTGPGAASTITATIEYNGTSQRLNFSASPSGSIPNGGTLWSDYLTVSIPAGATFWVRQYILNSAGLVLNFNIQNNTTLGECINVNTSGVADLTASTGTFAPNTNAWTLPPLAIVGMTSNPSMIIVCDSIGAGQGDTEDSSASATGFNAKVGTVARSLGNIPFVVVGRSGAKAQTWATDAVAANAILQKGSHLFIGLGTNDISVSARTPAQIITDIGTIAGTARSGQKVYVGTLAPRSNGPWTAPSSQQVTVDNVSRSSLNDSIRNVLAGTNGTYNIVSALETAQNSGLWTVTPAPPYTADGVHANLAGYQLVPTAGVISPVAWP